MGAEAAAFSAHEQLDNLIIMYDSNDVTLDKMAEFTMSEDTAARYVSYGWDVVTIDGHDLSAVSAVSLLCLPFFFAFLPILCFILRVVLWFGSSLCCACVLCGGRSLVLCRRSMLLSIGSGMDCLFCFVVGVFGGRK